MRVGSIAGALQKGGTCSTTGQKHVQLSGSSKGEFRTAWGSVLGFRTAKGPKL